MPETVDPHTGEILPAIVEVSDVVVPMSAFRLTETALVFAEAPSYEEWELMGRQLQYIAKCSPWWIGDWLVGGEALFKDKYLQAIHLTGNAQQTLLNYRWVAHKMPPERRRPGLSWTHHSEVAGLGTEDQERWLADAEDGNLTCAELRNAIKAECAIPGPPDEEEEEGAGLWLSGDDLVYLRQCLERIANVLTNTPVNVEIVKDAVNAALELLRGAGENEHS